MMGFFFYVVLRAFIIVCLFVICILYNYDLRVCLYNYYDHWADSIKPTSSIIKLIYKRLICNLTCTYRI